MVETSPPLLGSSKPHLEKLTLGVTRILGEWGGGAVRATAGRRVCRGSTEARQELDSLGQWTSRLYVPLFRRCVDWARGPFAGSVDAETLSQKVTPSEIPPQDPERTRE